MKTNNKGFSLVELIVVIAIMAILAAVAIPTFAGFIKKAQTGADEDFLYQTKYAIELANVETADFELVSISVDTTAQGAFTAVEYIYKINNGNEQTTTVTKGQTGSDASAAIDWNYKFKAYTNTTVTLEKNLVSNNWDGTWKVTIPNQ